MQGQATPGGSSIGIIAASSSSSNSSIIITGSITDTNLFRDVQSGRFEGGIGHICLHGCALPDFRFDCFKVG